MKVEDVMTRDVTTVSPETTLRDVAKTLAEKRIAGVPVVDDERHVVGVVSEGDIVTKEAGADPDSGLLGWLLAGRGPSKLEARTAAEAMTAPPVTIEPGRQVAEAARMMTERDVNRLPVVDAEGAVVGIVSRADLVRAFVRPDAELEREIREGVVLHTLWIDPASVDIAVREGEVSLAGELDKKADAELIEYFTSRVPGVVGVRSDLRWRVDEPRLPSSDPRIPEPPRR